MRPICSIIFGHNIIGSLLCWHNASIIGKLSESTPEPDQRVAVLDTWRQDYLETSLLQSCSNTIGITL